MRWWIVLLLGAAALLAASACKVKKREPQPGSSTETTDTPAPVGPSSPEVVALRDEVVAKVVFWGRPEYTPRDWSIIDPNIDWALKQPGSADRAARVEQAASAAYNQFVQQPEGLAALEKTLADRYAHPVITRDGDLVRIDLGIVAGHPKYLTRGGLTVDSPHREPALDGIHASEVIRNLKAGMAAQPGARRYQVEVDVPMTWPDRLPAGWKKGGFAYVYDTADDRIRVYDMTKPGTCYATAPIKGNWDGVTSLSWVDLTAEDAREAPVRSFDLANRSN